MSGYQPEGYSQMHLAIIEVCEDSMGSFERLRTAFACDLCGALVIDTPRHNRWHFPAEPPHRDSGDPTAEGSERPAHHNHLTRDIKAPGKCPACDRYHAQHAEAGEGHIARQCPTCRETT